MRARAAMIAERSSSLPGLEGCDMAGPATPLSTIIVGFVYRKPNGIMIPLALLALVRRKIFLVESSHRSTRWDTIAIFPKMHDVKTYRSLT